MSAATLKYKLQTKAMISPTHSIMTPGQPAPSLTQYRQADGRVAPGVSMMKSSYGWTVESRARPRDAPLWRQTADHWAPRRCWRSCKDSRHRGQWLLPHSLGIMDPVVVGGTLVLRGHQ